MFLVPGTSLPSVYTHQHFLFISHLTLDGKVTVVDGGSVPLPVNKIRSWLLIFVNDYGVTSLVVSR